MLFELLEGIRRWRVSAAAKANIKKYLASERKPWTPGYAEYKEAFLRETLQNDLLMDFFWQGSTLPAQHGFRLDERAVEYPRIISRLGVDARRLLDAGSALNFPYLLDLPELNSRSVVIYTLSPEREVKRRNVTYIYGDLRQTTLESESFDEIVCISTLEHVGMDNTFLYSKDTSFKECNPDDYQKVIAEFRRLLKPGGRLFITVPYGRYQNLGWLQQFDQPRVAKVIELFGGSAYNVTYYRYYTDGWQRADANSCADSVYFDIHHSTDYEPDYVAAARCVACLEMVK